MKLYLHTEVKLSGSRFSKVTVLHIKHKRDFKETFEDTLVYVGLRRIVTVAFLCRVQIFLLTYLLTNHR